MNRHKSPDVRAKVMGISAHAVAVCPTVESSFAVTKSYTSPIVRRWRSSSLSSEIAITSSISSTISINERESRPRSFCSWSSSPPLVSSARCAGSTCRSITPRTMAETCTDSLVRRYRRAASRVAGEQRRKLSLSCGSSRVSESAGKVRDWVLTAGVLVRPLTA